MDSSSTGATWTRAAGIAARLAPLPASSGHADPAPPASTDHPLSRLLCLPTGSPPPCRRNTSPDCHLPRTIPGVSGRGDVPKTSHPGFSAAAPIRVRARCSLPPQGDQLGCCHTDGPASGPGGVVLRRPNQLIAVHQCRKAARFCTDSPRDVRHAHSRLIAPANPRSRIGLKSASEVASTTPSTVSSSSAVSADLRRPDRPDECRQTCPARRPPSASRALRCSRKRYTCFGVLVRRPADEGLDQHVMSADAPARPACGAAARRRSVTRKASSPSRTASTPSAASARREFVGRHRPAACSASCSRGRAAGARRTVTQRHGVAGRAGRPRSRPRRSRAACTGAAADIRARLAGSSTTRRVHRPRSAGSWPATSTPLTPSATATVKPADRGRDHRRARGLRLQGDQPERLVVAGHRDHVGGPVELRPARPPAPAAGNQPVRRRPSCSARSSSRCSSGRPVPDSPPTMTTRHRRSGCWLGQQPDAP